MAVKHVPTNEVHSGSKGGRTGCGFNTNELPSHRENTSSKITCEKMDVKTNYPLISF